MGRRHISTSGFAYTATETAVFALFLPVQPSDLYWMVQMDFLAANHVRIVGYDIAVRIETGSSFSYEY